MRDPHVIIQDSIMTRELGLVGCEARIIDVLPPNPGDFIVCYLRLIVDKHGREEIHNLPIELATPTESFAADLSEYRDRLLASQSDTLQSPSSSSSLYYTSFPCQVVNL